MIFPLALLIFTIGACEKLVENTDEARVNVPIEKRYFRVDSSLLFMKGGDGQSLLYEEYVNINTDSLLAAHGLDYVTSAKVNDLTIGVEDPACDKLYFLDEATVVVSATEDFRNSVKIAYALNISTDTNTLQLNVMNMDLAEEITSGGFYLNCLEPLKTGRSISPAELGCS